MTMLDELIENKTSQVLEEELMIEFPELEEMEESLQDLFIGEELEFDEDEDLDIEDNTDETETSEEKTEDEVTEETLLEELKSLEEEFEGLEDEY